MKEQEKAGRRPYIYKLAATNPRNPLNKADELEKELIRKFNEGEIESFEDIIERGGEKYLYKAIPIAENKKSCMRCHGDPKETPNDILTRYGDKDGYFEKTGRIRAIVSLMVPLDGLMLEAKKYFYVISLVMGIVMLLIYSSICFFIKQQRKFTAKEKEVAERTRASELESVYRSKRALDYS